MSNENSSERNKSPKRGPGRAPAIDKAKDTRKTLARLWQYVKIYRKRFIIIFTFIAISSLTSVLVTYSLKTAVDKYIMPKDFTGLLWLVLTLAIITLLGAVGNVIGTRMMTRISQETMKNIREEVFGKILKLPIKFYDTHSHGELMSRITNDLDNLGTALTESIIQAFSSLISFAGILISMIIISPTLSLINIVSLPIIITVAFRIANLNKKQFIEQQEKLGELNGFIEEHISGQYVVKAFGREEKLEEEFLLYNKNYQRAGIKAQIFSGVIMPLIRNLNGIVYAIVIVAAGVLSIVGRLSIGAFTSFASFSRHFSRPINEFSEQLGTIQLGIAGAERCFEILDENEETLNDNNKVELKNVKGEVKIENIYFSYEEDKPVLKNVSIDVKPGELVALVGATGAGKTTIINLITRFYDVNKGRILIDGIDIKDMTRKSLREALGIVLQDAVLFSETVKKNIAYGKLNATDEEIAEAAELANAKDFIERLPEDYNTELTEDGNNLSVGQKQLLNIARVFLNQPSILILDEATSNVDTRTEIHIQDAMRQLMKGRTSFVIAHRLSTIRRADKILVIENGEIVEEGTHKALIEKEGRYYTLYKGLQGD
jgi:ATP-binding cassette subfamily B protein